MPVHRREDLFEAVAVHVGHRHVLVVHARAVTRVAAVARWPARTHGAVGLEDVELEGGAGGRAHDDLELAVGLQIGHCERAELTDAERVSRPYDAAESVVDGQLGPARDDHLQRADTGQVGNGDAGPDSVATRPSPLEAPIRTVQRHDVIGSPDHVGPAVAVEVRHGRR